MAKTIQGTRNTNDDPNRMEVVAGSITFVDFFPANPDRLQIVIANPENQAMWLRMQEAGVDNIGRDYLIPAGTTVKIFDATAIGTGATSVKMSQGGSKTIRGLEY